MAVKTQTAKNLLPNPKSFSTSVASGAREGGPLRAGQEGPLARVLNCGESDLRPERRLGMGAEVGLRQRMQDNPTEWLAG